MIKLYVHYGCFMFVHLHKTLIPKPSFVHSCPGYSSGSTPELPWVQCKVCVGKGLQAGEDLSTAKTSPLIPGNKPAISWFCNNQIVAPLWIFLFCVLLRGAVYQLPSSPRGISLERNAMCYCSNACLGAGITKTPHQQRKLNLFINCM